MSHDERLRRLERAFRASGAAEDEAEWLRERVRAGELDGARLDATAALGHPASRLAVGRAPAEQAASLGELRLPLQAVGPVALGRAAVVAAELVLPLWETTHAHDPRPRLAIQAARAWTRCPCTPHLQEARALGLQVHVAVGGQAAHAAQAAMHCGALLGTERVSEAVLSAVEAGLDRTALVGALRAELLPWLLS